MLPQWTQGSDILYSFFLCNHIRSCIASLILQCTTMKSKGNSFRVKKTEKEIRHLTVRFKAWTRNCCIKSGDISKLVLSSRSERFFFSFFFFLFIAHSCSLNVYFNRHFIMICNNFLLLLPFFPSGAVLSITVHNLFFVIYTKRG